MSLDGATYSFEFGDRPNGRARGSTPIAEAVAEYVRDGWAVVKLPPRSKGDHGMREGWNSRANAVTDPTEVLGWHGNFGVALAFSRLVSIDIDDLDSANEWFEQHGINLMHLLAAHDAVRIDSGRVGRAKLLYRVPDGVDPLTLLSYRIKNSDRKMMLELRCAGRGGVTEQDVLPPSIHPVTGKPYVWHGDWRRVPVLPDALLTLWREVMPTARARGTQTLLGDGTGADFLDFVQRLKERGCKPYYAGPSVRAYCPHHGGESGNTLKVDETADGKLLVHCFAGCSFENVLAGLGLGPGPEVRFGSGAGTRHKNGEDSVDDGAGDANDAPWLREVPLAGVATAPPVGVSFAVLPILPRGEVTIMGGHGGAGKSIFALTLAVAAACGETWCGFEPSGPLKVADVTLEDHGDIVRSRVRNILHETRLSPQCMEGGLRVFDGSDGETALAVEVIEQGVRSLKMTTRWREVAEACDGADIIIIDNASDAYAGDENNRAQVRSFMRHLRALARKCNAAVLLLCHIDKAAARGGAQGNSYSGSTAWHNASRSRLALIPNADDTVSLVHERSSHKKKAEPTTLAWTDTGVLLPLNGQQRSAEAARDAEDVLTVLARAEQLGIRIPTATRGSSTAWHAVALLPGLPASLTGKDASRRFLTTLLWLAEAGKVVRVDHTDEYRHKRWFWELAKPAGASA